MNKAGVFHTSKDQWCYAVDSKTLHIRLRTAKDDIDKIEIVYGDPFEWKLDPKTKDLEKEYRKGFWDTKQKEMNLLGSDDIFDYWEIYVSPPYRRLKYWFKLYKDGTVWEYGENLLKDSISENNTWNTFIFPYLHEKEVFNAPDWVAETVWYQIFPERFENGDKSLNTKDTKEWNEGPVTNLEFYGGDIPGIIQRLDHIADLGFNGLYLTPIFESTSVHKYNTTDYMKIDPAFGSEEDLKTLVKECHKRGIRIILDAVFNHSGTNFAPWVDVLENGEKSKYKDWFHIRDFPLFTNEEKKYDSHYANFDTFAFTTGMPKLNTQNPKVKEYLLGVAEHYIKEFDIDGWRLDVANEVDYDFWREFRQRVKSTKEDAYIVGEVWHDSTPWLRGDQYDAVMNYHYGVAIVNWLKNTVAFETGKKLAEQCIRMDMRYARIVLRSMFNLLDSHDTERLMNNLDGDINKARLAWVLLAFIPGSPCFYYGSEIPLSGGHDPDCRRCMLWDKVKKDSSQYQFIKDIVQIRKENSELYQKGDHKWLFSEKEKDVFGIRFTYNENSLLVLVNRSKEDKSIDSFKELLSQSEIAAIKENNINSLDYIIVNTK